MSRIFIVFLLGWLGQNKRKGYYYYIWHVRLCTQLSSVNLKSFLIKYVTQDFSNYTKSEGAEQGFANRVDVKIVY